MSSVLMVQGTTSDAGKSTLVAALCRIFAEDGLSVAPFKPQNMALNSAVTEDGGEIGRAQALQAFAAKVPLSVHMNPVLLKPSTDTGAQVILQGKALSNMEAQSFHDYKKHAMTVVLDSLAQLQKKYPAIIVEGAGSPAEINLRENDIANMGFAEKVDCPVILIADIDRGGVFAHLVGTLNLLSQSEQQRVVGFVINRFRGDIALLQPGLDWLEKTTGKPVLGVLPYLHNLILDQEDAIDSQQLANSTQLNIVVPVLPRMSNHTDFDVFRMHPDINLQFVAADHNGEGADLIILPGSKNVRQDLAYLKQKGWQKKLDRHLRYGGKLFGICGGFQMLGEQIHDPDGIEGKPGSETGFGYMPAVTHLQPHKILANKQGTLRFGASKGEGEGAVHGYEIHCGTTEFTAPVTHIVEFEGVHAGFLSDDQHIAGCYLHGLWDLESALSATLKWLDAKVATQAGVNTLREQQIVRLAESTRAHMDIPRTWGLMKQWSPAGSE